MSIPPIHKSSIRRFLEHAHATARRITELTKKPTVKQITWASDVADDEPEYPECTCLPTCNRFECKGKCGCRGCEVGYMNFLSGQE